MSMITWKMKLTKKNTRGSHSTGKSKGIIPTPLQKTMCRRNRSWKHPLYSVIMGSGIFARKGAQR